MDDRRSKECGNTVSSVETLGQIKTGKTLTGTTSDILREIYEHDNCFRILYLVLPFVFIVNARLCFSKLKFSFFSFLSSKFVFDKINLKYER